MLTNPTTTTTTSTSTTLTSTPSTTTTSTTTTSTPSSTGIFHPGTPILLYDGTIKLAKDINIDDVLMGDDSSPITINKIEHSNSEMYKISPIKGDPFYVGKDHILALQLSKNAYIAWRGDRNYYEVRWYDEKAVLNAKQFKVNNHMTKENCEKEANIFRNELNEIYKGTVIDLALSDYIAKNKTWKTFWKLYRTPINFQCQGDIDIDPYLIGAWLGDGTSSKSEITNIDPEIIKYLEEKLPEMDMHLKQQKTKNGECTITYSMKGNGWRNNIFLKELQNTSMLNNKHIPQEYKLASKENRLKLLAGLIDTDGSLSNGCYDIIQKSTILSNDIVFVARSCGFATYPEKCKKGCWYKGEYKEGEYNRMCISGDINNIPVLIPRKKSDERKQIKNVLKEGFSVDKSDDDKCVTFQISTKKRFVLGDFTVTGGCTNCVQKDKIL